MAEVKWIKIVTDIFDDEKILLIETLPEADSIIVIWFKLLCLAGKQNNSGVFMLNDRMPYNEKMFATIFRRKETTIQLALKTFEEFGMIEILDGAVTIPNWGKHQTLDQIEQKNEYMRNYMRRYREKQMLLACNTNSKANSKANVSCAEEDKKENKNKSKNKDIMHGAKPVPEPAFIQLPLNDKTFYPVTFTAMDGWRELYPIVDIEQELRKMKGWLDSNPKKRKTSRGIKAFINSWLAREQDKGRQPTKVNTANPFDELLRKELQNEQSRNNSPYENNQRLLPGVLPEGRG